ncbi:MAG: hypothetical protein IJ627_03140 [Bacteroidales bacterium]|nr:hypothetical protein [Bacteroidales bacterium]
MTKKQIISQLAKQRTVEDICQNVAHVRSMSADVQDLAQLVYVVLLEYPEEKVKAMWQAGSLRFFVSRIVMNQYRCPRSAFRKIVSEFGHRSEEINPETFAAVSVIMEPTGHRIGHVETRAL